MASLYSLKNTDNQVVNYDNGNLIVLSTPNFNYNISDGDSYHLVEAQDTLEDLANKYYKDPKLWYVLAVSNIIINPFDLEVGSQLIIPKID